jgi:glycine/D-amino acid oxidase-like deaminating enzyme
MDQAFDDNASVWLDGAPDDVPAAPLDRDLEVDVAIVGGGFTGVSTAYHLSRRRPELGVVLLEAKQLGNGATGRNGGLMINGITVLEPSAELAATDHAMTRAAIDEVERLITEHRLPVRFERKGCLHVSTSAKGAEGAHAWVEELAPRGVPLRYVPKSELRMAGAHGAILDPTEALIAGVDLVRAMRPLIATSGVSIYEGTPVTRIREGATIELTTPRATVRARAIVLATSGYTPRLGYFTTGLLPVISHVIATEPLGADLLERTGLANVAGFFDDLPRLAYGSIDSAGRLVFGGGTTEAYGYRYGNRTTFDAQPGDEPARALQSTLLRYFPDLASARIAHRWSGPLDLTLSRHCAMGVLGEHENVYYALGYSGHGITLANLAGRVLTDLYCGDHDPWRKAAFYMKRPSGIPPEPMRWIGYQLYTRLTGKSPWKRTA